jgi:O-antigen ligase
MGSADIKSVLVYSTTPLESYTKITMFRSTIFVKGTQWLGLSGLYLFALSGGVSTAGFNIGIYLMLIALLIQLPVNARRLLREPLLWGSLLLGLYLAYSTYSAINEFPMTSDFQTKRSWRWFMISGFFSLVCAWWIAARTRHLGLLLGLATAGFFLSFVFKTDWSQWQHYISGALRIDMDSLNPNKTGWYAAMFCSGLMILVYRYIHVFSRSHLSLHLLRISASLALCIFFGLFLLWSQSRAAWLAFGVVVLLLTLLLLIQGYSRRQFNVKHATVILAVTLLSLYLVQNTDIIKKRIAYESDTIRSLSADQISELPMNSVGTRLKLWEYGIDKFQQRPLLGWGLGTMNTQASVFTHGEANHLHNFYLETLVGLGAVGATLLLFNIVLIQRLAWRAYRNGTMEREMGILLLALFILTVVFQFFSTHLGTQGKFFMILLGGLACSYHFRRISVSPNTTASDRKE